MNHPLNTDGTDVFLVGHGYAPVVTVRGGDGKVAYRGPVVFLPQDSSFASYGVIKVPDAGPEQLGFQGLFLPTYGFTMSRGPFSQFPDALDPALSLVPYHGDLGLDSGKPQSVYQLDKSKLKTYPSSDPSRLGPVKRIKLTEGQTARLPDGQGSIKFDGVQRWVKLQVSHSPGKGLALGGVLLGIVGLMGSLFIRPRRAWVRVSRGPGRAYRGRAGRARPQLRWRPRRGGRRARAARSTGAPSGRDQRRHHVTTAQFAAFSDNAIMFASIVYALAFLAHLIEWVVRPLAARPGDRRACASRRWRGADVSEIDRRSRPRQAPTRRRTRSCGSRSTAGSALALTIVGCALHFLGLVSRGLGSDPIRVPWGNMYEFTLAGTFGVSLMYLVLMKRYHLRWMGVLVTGFLVVVLMLDQLVLYQDAGPLVPALHSYWLAIHVLAAIIASGAFAVGALTLVLFLVKDRAARRGTLATGGYLSRLPAARAWSGWPTGCTRSGSRSGRSRRWSPGRSGRSTPGAATGTGTPRRCGRSSPG